MLRTISIVLLLPLLAAGVERDPTDYVRIEPLSQRVLLAWWVGTGRCNLTPIQARSERQFGRSDWAYVINTHAHMHHAGGNSLFRNAVVVGHENLVEDMQWLIDKQTDPDRRRMDLDGAARTLQTLRANLGQVAGNRTYTRMIQGEIRFWELYIKDAETGYELVRPSLTFADRHTLDLGDLTLELAFFGKGHSLSDILIYIPQERLLVTGAIAYQRAHLPEIGEQSEMQDVQRFFAVLDELLDPTMQVARVVPSHSPPLRKSDLVPVRAYYEKMLAGVQAAQREGLSFEQAAERLAQRRAFAGYLEPPPGHWAHGMHRRNLRNLWRIVQDESASVHTAKTED
jgi:glyoxylase-like metal-dependent hydrolase (beta-lactamase superfamily II)